MTAAPSPQAQAQPDPVLCKFYQVDSFSALVAAMDSNQRIDR